MDSSAKANAELRDRIRQQEVVADLGQQALETDDIDGLIHDASAAVAETLGTEYCTVLELLPDDEGVLRQGVGWCDDLVGTATVSTDLDSQAGYTLRSEAPVIVDDLRTEERFSGSRLFTDRDIVSGISVVVGSVEEPWGVLETHTTRRREFTANDATFVKNVANVLAAAIDRTNTERRLRDRERRLERYKEYTDDVLAAVDDVFYVVDGDGNFQWWNETLNDVTGYSDAEIESMHPLEFIAEADRDAIANGIAEVFETGSSRVEADVLTKTDERIPYEFVASRLENPDGDPVLAGIGRDVTEREERNRELAEYERIVETINDGIYVVDEELRYTMVNDAFTELTGYTREELRGEHATRIVDETALERAAQLRAEMADDETTNPTLETTVRTADGDRVPVEVTFASLTTGEETKRVGVVRDVTDREEQRRKLEESERRYRTLVENFPNGAVGLFDENLRYTVAGGEALVDVGVSTEEIVGQSVRERYPEEVAAQVEPNFRAALAGDSNSFELEFHGRHWLAHTVPVQDDDGTIFAGMVMVQDVTERKAHERDLARFKRAVEASGHAIHMSNLDEEITYVNPAFEETTGYAAAEVIGESPRILESGEHDDEYYRALRETVRAGDVWEAEIVDRRKDGELYHAEQTIAPVTDEHGEIDRFVAVQNDITERKERERALEESEAKFRMLAENLEEMVWLSDPDTRELLYLNPAMERIWGRDREWLYENPLSFLDAVHPDDRQRVRRAYNAMPDDEFDEEYRIVRPDGEVRWLDVRAVPVRNEERERVVGIAEDITERKERERALEESERRYRTLVEHFPNGAVGMFDDDLCYTAVGGNLLGATSVDPENRIGRRVSEIYPDEIVEEVEPYFDATLEGEANEFEIEYHGRHLFAHTVPVRNADGDVFAGMLVVQDVTERREYQRQLEESNERLEQFAYAASHDLQEPLRMVSSYLQLIERRYGDVLDEDGEEFLAFAVDGADRMRSMIEGLLQYSRVETRGDEFEPVDLETVLEDVRENLRMKIGERDAEITATSLPLVEGDAGQLRQVFQNLLSNAIDYSGDEPPRVHVAAEWTGAEWTLSVTDEGIGIDPDDQERIFEVFQRLHGETSGTGIGLALCERIVERHGGDIWVESEPGEGATFSFTLPAASADPG